MIKIWFGDFIYWHINFCRLFNAQVLLLEEQEYYYLTLSWEDNGIHTFPKSECISATGVRTHNDSTAECFNH